MRYFVLLALLLLTAGCGPVGPIPLLGALAGSGGGDGSDAPPPPPFALTVDSLLVEGTVTDNLDSDINFTVNGNPVTVSAGTFSELLDSQTQRSFLFRALDDAGNLTELHIQVE